MVSGVSPLLTYNRLGLVKFEPPPAAMRQEAVLGAKRECFGWAEHGEVQAGEERDEPFSAPGADVAHSGE
jgi:hypothetical protein